MDDVHPLSAMRFAVPIAVENAATVGIGLAFSAIIGGVSGSALAAVGTSNTLISFLTAALSMLTTGSIVLVARYAGARDTANASNMIEQSLLMTIGLTIAVSVACIALAAPILRLLLPTAENALFQEAVSYFRVLMLSFPFLMIYNVEVGVLRATGNSRASMYASILMNITQLLCAWLFISRMGLDMIGAGLSYVICRVIGACIITAVLLRGSALYHVHLPNLRKPDFGAFRRIARIGLPMTLEQISVQGGYVLANSLAVGLGTFEAGVYQVTNTINTFPAMPQSICSAVALTIVGQQIGAGQIDKAKKSETRIWLTCIATCTALALLMALLGTRITGLYTQDAETARQSALMLWIMIGYAIAGGSINTVDPALKAGGEQKFVMIMTAICVWGIRLPLTWILGYTCHMGITGVMIANIITLTARMIAGLIKRRKGQWIHETL